MLGAGFSIFARDSTSKLLPLGAELAQELRTEFGYDEFKSLSLPQLYTILAAKDREAADAYLRQRFTVASFDDRYLSLPRLAVRAIFTTNIDDLPRKIYASSSERYLNDLTERGPIYKDKAAVGYLPLHGSVTDDARPFRFTSLEIASSFSADPTLWHTVRGHISEGPTLFWGYSLQDAAALEALHGGDATAGARGTNWIVLRPDEENEPLAEYFRALQFRLVFAETDEVLGFLEALRSGTPAVKSTFSAVKQYQLPESGSVPQRPIVDFYSGAAPAWSDIFRGDLHRVEQHRKAEDALSQGRSAVITGIPASGKTTLLMQLAASGAGAGMALMPDSLTAEAAGRLVRSLDGAPSTVFLDNVTDDIEVLNILAMAKNVVVVAADRDYNVATVMHRFDSPTYDIISLSEISEYDLGAIRSRIPPAIRTPKMFRPEVTKGLPSLLEFNLANTNSRSLALRLEDALLRFQRDEPVAAEMLLLVAYVHSCRIVLSLDMALGYWHGDISSWRDIYLRVESVGQLLSEYEGELREDAQEYFAARSLVVVDATLRSAGSALLRRVLERFHYNLPTTRICRYDIFRRRGYSHQLFSRAFPRVEDALEFYNYLFSRDPNPYLLQQKALMLNGRKLYAESFVEIDRALGMTNGRNWTLQATHAQLLFDANLPLAATSREARKQVDRAMTLLRTCYLSDRRRSLHAFRFADQAIEYYSVFGDEQARDYLVQAGEWLHVVQRREPFMTRTRYLLRDLGRLLS